MMKTEAVTDRTGKFRYWIGDDTPELGEPAFWIKGEQGRDGCFKYVDGRWVQSRLGEMIDHG